MQSFLSAVVLGVSAGALDALLALGIVLIYRTTGVLNFAQAAIGTLAAYVIYAVAQGRPLWIALAAGLAVAAVLGAATHQAIRGIHTSQYALTAAVATLAAAIVIQQIVRISWGATVGGFPNPFGTSSVTIAGVTMLYSELAGVVIAAGLAVFLGGFLRWSRTGTMLRALADNQDAARLCGANVHLLAAGIWALAGVLAGVAAFFAAQLVFAPSFLDPYFLAALIAAVLGGLRSLTGAFLGALSLEVARNLFEIYAPSSLSPYVQTFLIVLLIGVLVLAPRGWLASTAGRTV